MDNRDAKDFIAEVKQKLPRRSLIYCDPPYYNKGKMLYKNCYTMEDHRDIALVMRELDCPWMVTYDNVSQICELYEGCSCEGFEIAYSAHIKRSRGEEIMFYGNLELPSSPYARKGEQCTSRAI